ncbi:hypothetical protein F4810DRAFT_675509 [Camillea tinctor]|nr:hypothetical protein F4810DRAFT_675509 [Camillea tinctor]
MGSKASKPVQTATRKFPSRSPGSPVPPAPLRPSPRSSPRSPEPQTSFTKDDAIQADSLDPDFDTDPLTSNPAFSQRLRQMGVANPHPTLSHSSTVAPRPAHSPAPGPPNPNTHYPEHRQQNQNRTLNALEARAAIQLRARAESEDPRAGRELVDVGILKQVLQMRARGAAPADIERKLRLKQGVVRRLGPESVVELVSIAPGGGGWTDGGELDR